MLATALAAGCASEFVPMNGVSTYTELDENGEVFEVGVMIPTSEIDSLDQYAAAIERFSAEAASQTYVDHAQVLFEPQGHDATGVADVAHLDIHFHGIKQEARESIDCQDEPMPDESRLPHAYVIDATGEVPWFGTCVKSMGVHAADENAQGQDPDNKAKISTLVEYGYHDGEMSFVMSLVHLDVLLDRNDAEKEIMRPAELGRITQFPSRFRATYDETEGAYRFALMDFSTIN